jgi:hypothetical protein
MASALNGLRMRTMSDSTLKHAANTGQSTLEAE